MKEYLISTYGYKDSILTHYDEKHNGFILVVNIDTIEYAIDDWCKEYMYKFSKESIKINTEEKTVTFKYTEDFDNNEEKYRYDATWHLYETKKL